MTLQELNNCKLLKKEFGCKECVSEFTSYGPGLKSLDEKRGLTDKLEN